MAKGNPLQQQLLKAGLVKKAKVAEVAREQHKARHGKGQPKPGEIQQAAERARAEKAERDRALAAERKARAQAAELTGQARQIIDDRKVPHSGELEYRFAADGAIRTLLVDDALRKQLAAGTLVVARLGGGYALLPRAAAAKVYERDASLIVLDHGKTSDTGIAEPASDDDAYYAQFEVPDDLTW